MDRHCDNAERVVEFLDRPPGGRPGLSTPACPTTPATRSRPRQMKRFGGMVSFRVTGGEEQALDVCDRTEVFTLGESLGGVESLIEHPGRMTHATRRRHRRSRCPPTWSGSASASRPSTTCSPTSTGPSADPSLRRPSASTSARRSPRRCWSTSAEGRIVAAAEHRDHDRHRRPRRVRRVPGRADRGGPAGRRAPRCWPAPAPAAGCGSPWSATRSWSPPRPAAGSRSPAAARWSPSRVGRAPGHDLRAVHDERAGRRAADRRHRRRQRARCSLARPRGPGGRRLARPGRGRRQRRRPRRGRGDPGRTSRTCSPTTWCPQIGVLAPTRRARAIREMFLVPRDRRQAPEPARRLHRDGPRRHPRRRAHRRRAAGPRRATPATVVVVDVGGATTDVHSVVELDPEAGRAGPRGGRAPRPVTRTVEGDLGMRWSAVSTVEEAGLARPGRRPREAPRTTDPGFLPDDRRRSTTRTRRIARAAVGLALRRHAGRSPGGGQPRGPGRRAHRQGPARGRPAGRLRRRAAPRPARRRRPGARRPASATSTAAGSCPARPRGRRHTTTCWPRPGCWPPSTPTRRTGLVDGSCRRPARD